MSHKIELEFRWLLQGIKEEFPECDVRGEVQDYGNAYSVAVFAPDGRRAGLRARADYCNHFEFIDDEVVACGPYTRVELTPADLPRVLERLREIIGGAS